MEARINEYRHQEKVSGKKSEKTSELVQKHQELTRINATNTCGLAWYAVHKSAQKPKMSPVISNILNPSKTSGGSQNVPLIKNGPIDSFGPITTHGDQRQFQQIGADNQKVVEGAKGMRSKRSTNRELVVGQ